MTLEGLYLCICGLRYMSPTESSKVVESTSFKGYWGLSIEELFRAIINNSIYDKYEYCDHCVILEYYEYL